MATHKPANLQRWNRAGLHHFRYVNGNAATYLEELRIALSERITHWKVPEDEGGSAEAESALHRIRRLEAQYAASSSGDPLRELARAFSRSCHILTEHVNAFANEGFIETATQWEYLRRLLYPLDHFPAAPASAVTRLVLLAKPGVRGTLPAGFRVGSQGGRGPSVTFETLQDAKVDSELNALRVAGWNVSEEPLGKVVEVDGRLPGLAPGQPMIVEHTPGGSYEVLTIVSVAFTEKTTRIGLSAAPSGTAGTARLHLAPKDVLEVVGPAVPRSVKIRFKDAVHGLGPGQVVFVRTPREAEFRQAIAVDQRAVTLEREIQDPSSIAPALALPINSQSVPGDYSRLANMRVAYVDSEGLVKLTTISSAVYYSVGAQPGLAGQTKLELSPSLPAGVGQIFIPPTSGYLALDVPLDFFQHRISVSRSKTAAPGDFFILSSEGQQSVGRVASIAPHSTEPALSELTFTDTWPAPSTPFWASTTRVLTGFRTVSVSGAQLNRAPLAPSTVQLEAAPGALKAGMTVIFEREGAASSGAFETRVIGIDGNNITLSPTLPAGLFNKGDTFMRANTVLASHGKGQPEVALGSGDATQANQTFVLDRRELSFVPDSSQPTGVRAAVDVIVGNTLWQQRGRLNDSGPTDAHFTVRITEEGKVAFHFGDGTHGRRLPTGNNNVRVRFRLGAGSAGNVPAGSLTEVVTPHGLIGGVRQPLPSSGGNEAESTRSLRESAPSSTLTLGRAVSLGDLAQIASRHSSVTEAAARRAASAGSRDETIELIVVPAGAQPEKSSGGLGALGAAVEAHVRAHAPPHVRVRAVEFVRKPFHLTLALGVDPSAADAADVVARVRSALLARFGLQARGLGRSVSQGEVYTVVEHVEGVAHSRILVLFAPHPRNTGHTEPRLDRVVAAQLDEVAFLETDNLVVTPEPGVGA
jgi:hypothetical protein